jgi:signal transduction histidine kinase
LPLSATWVGIFVLYYAARTTWRLSAWLPAAQADLLKPGKRFRRYAAVPLPLLLDLLVITGLVALSGGWASPLYLLYLGWAAALLDVPSTPISLCLSGLACSVFVLAVLLAPHQPFSALQITLLAEHALLLLLAALGVSGISVSIKHTKSMWEAEHRQWEALRQAVFSQLSHELYTPLSAISASASLLAVEGEAAEIRQSEIARVIERNCAHMNVLIDDLLALWRAPHRQPGYAPRSVPCLPLAESVGQMLGPLLEGKQQGLIIEAEPQHICALADRRRLEQVLLNLLVNAHKYAPAGAAITLTVRGQRLDVLFSVHDEGAGVPLEEQSRLFELFYRGTNHLASSRGFGIGLALAKALVVLQGGHIWVESLPGRGSTFYFTLPAAEPG